MKILVLALTWALAWTATAQTKEPPRERPASGVKVDSAKARCKANRGVDCDTPEGLKEWLLQERSREAAVRDGSRHAQPTQPRPAPSRP